MKEDELKKITPNRSVFDQLADRIRDIGLMQYNEGKLNEDGDALNENWESEEYTVKVYDFAYDQQTTELKQNGTEDTFKVKFSTSTENNFVNILPPDDVEGEILESDLGDTSSMLESYYSIYPKGKMWTKIKSTWDDKRKAEIGAIALALITFLYCVGLSYPPDGSDGGIQNVKLSQFLSTPTPGSGISGPGATGYDYSYEAVYPASNTPTSSGQGQGGETTKKYPASGDEKVTEYIEISGIGSGTTGMQEKATYSRMMTKVRKFMRIMKQDEAAKQDYIAV